LKPPFQLEPYGFNLKASLWGSTSSADGDGNFPLQPSLTYPEPFLQIGYSIGAKFPFIPIFVIPQINYENKDYGLII